eukprot:401083-Prorocentrum_minimum.AAC.1
MILIILSIAFAVRNLGSMSMRLSTRDTQVQRSVALTYLGEHVHAVVHERHAGATVRSSYVPWGACRC